MKRSAEAQNLCLMDYVSDYTYNSKGQLRKRDKSLVVRVVPRIPRDPKNAEKYEQYCYVLSPEDSACSICGAGDHKAAVCALRPTESCAAESPRAAAFHSAAGNAGSRRAQNSDPCRLFNFAPTGCGYGSRCVFRHVCEECGNKGHRAECQATGKQQQQPAPQGPRAQSPRPQ